EAAHAVVAHQRVLQRVLERVPHVQRAGDVGRRQQHRVGRARAAGLEQPRGLPALVEPGFELGGVVAGGQGVGHCSLFPLSRLREEAGVRGALKSKAALIRPSGTLSRKREKGNGDYISCFFNSNPRALYCLHRSRSGSRAAGSAGTTSSTRSKPPSTAASRRLITSGRIGASASGGTISTSASSSSMSSPAIWCGMKASGSNDHSRSSSSSAWARSRTSTRVGRLLAKARLASSHTRRSGSSRNRSFWIR